MTGAIPGDASGSGIRLLRDRTFGPFWWAGLVSTMGTWAQSVTVAVVVYERTGSAVLVGLVGLANSLPILVFALVGGAAADRHPRDRLIVATHLASAAVAGVGVVAVLADVAVVEILVLMTAATSALYAFAKPALNSVIPDLVGNHELEAATGMNSLQVTLGQIAGPLVAALLLAAGLPAVAIATNLVSYLAPAIVMRLEAVRTRAWSIHGDPSGTPRGSGGSSASGQAPVAPSLRPGLVAALVCLSCVSGIPEVVRVLAPIIAAELGQDESFAGLIVSARSIGGAAGLVLLTLVATRVRARSGPIVLGSLAEGMGLLLMISGHGPVAGLAGAAVVGFGFAISFSSVTARIQRRAPRARRGRVMSIDLLAHQGIRPPLTIVASGIAAVLGGSAALLAFAPLIPLAILLARSERRSGSSSADRTDLPIVGSDLET